MENQNLVHPNKPIIPSDSSEAPHPHTKSLLKLPKWLIATIIVTCFVLVGGVIMTFPRRWNKNVPTKSTNTLVVTVPTAAPAAQWKIYTNTKYNYVISYPNDWSVSESPNSKDGVGFNPPDASDAISIFVGQKVGNYEDSLEQYAKVAATAEIQNYNKLASFKKITTAYGTVGYETTWMVQPMTVMGRPPTEGDSESLPITYFEIPGNKTSLVRVTLERKEDLDTYEKMLTTVKVMAPLTPIPTVDEADVLKYVIKKYIALKHNSNENSLTLSVSKIEGNYAQGGVSDEGGGGMWFAAKEDGVWKLVWDGNGVIQCSVFTLYPDFSKSMIPECYDEATQNTIQR